MAESAKLIRKNYTSLNVVESYSVNGELVLQDFTDATFGGTPIVATFGPGADGGYVRLKRSSSGTTDAVTPAAGMLVFPTALSSPHVLTLQVRDLDGRQGAEIRAFGVNIPRALTEARHGVGAFGERLLELISRRFASSNESA